MASKRNRAKSNKPEPATVPEVEVQEPAAQAAVGRARAWLAWVGFLLVLLSCFAWVLGHACLVDTVTVRLCENMDRDLPKEKRMPVFLAEIAFDGYMWNRLAEELGQNGEWRARFTKFDNSPEGRESHWSSGFALYLRGMGEIYRAINGDSLRNSIFRMSIWANPILLVLAIGIFSTLSARRFGPLCGTVLAAGMVSVPTFYEGFMPAYPDHHGIIAFCILGMLFGIAWAGAGWVQAPEGTDFVPPHSLRQARHGMIFSGVCAATGVWISAFSIVVVLFGIGIAAILSVALFSGRELKKNPVVFHPEVWKLWGLTAASGSLIYYLIEYFPNHLGMRLEPNHPLYSVALFAGGYGIFASTKWISRADRSLRNVPWLELLACAAACASLPAVILADPARFYIVLEPFMAKMSANIAETLPLLTRIRTGGLTWQMAFGWFPIFLIAAIVLIRLKPVGRGTKAILVFLSIPILFITALQFYQVRWGMLAGPLYIGLAAIVIPQLWRLVPRQPAMRIGAAAVLAGFAYLFVQPSFANCFSGPWAQYNKGLRDIPISFGQGLALLHRQMARAILDSADGKPIVLLSSPNSSCILTALGGFRTVGTLYWENVEGLKKAARALNAQSDDEALSLFRQLGVTHVSLMTWENFVAPFFGILYPQPVPGKDLANSFGIRALQNKQIPMWTRPLIFPPNQLSKALQQQILLLQLAPDQSRREAQFHLARFARYVEDNPVAAEMSYRELLEANAKNPDVRLELADLMFAQKRASAAAEEILKALPDSNPAQRAAIGRGALRQLTLAKEWTLRALIARALVAFPDASPETLENSAWIFATSPDPGTRDPKLALSLAERLQPLTQDQPRFLLAQSAALAANGDFQLAATTVRQAAALAPENAEIQSRSKAMAEAFDSGKPWIEEN